MQTEYRNKLRNISIARENYRKTKKLFEKAYYFSLEPTLLKHILVIAQERTGSTMFLNLLSSHPRILVDPHSFFSYDYWPYKVSKDQKTYSRKSVIVSKFKVANDLHEEKQGLIEVNQFLQNLSQEGVLIVHLKRDNKFRQAISLCIANSQNRLHRLKGERLGESHSIRIDPEQLMQVIHGFEKLSELELKALDNVPNLSLTYEKDLLNGGQKQRVFDALCKKLDLELVPATTQYIRTSKNNLDSSITNYQEIYELLEENGLDRYLPHNDFGVNND